MLGSIKSTGLFDVACLALAILCGVGLILRAAIKAERRLRLLQAVDHAERCSRCDVRDYGRGDEARPSIAEEDYGLHICERRRLLSVSVNGARRYVDLDCVRRVLEDSPHSAKLQAHSTHSTL